jgi:hypothetical protein
VAAGIVGSGLFILSLPFTVPSGGVKDAARILIKEPFSFSFKRDFPDPDLCPDGYKY